MQMSTFDTLSTYDELVRSGLTTDGARIQTKILAKVAEPGVDLKAAFENIDRRFENIDRRFENIEIKFDKKFEAIDKRFELMDKDFSYLRLIGIGIILAIVSSFIKSCCG